ncbi:unnamed protein product, partial [marine sediment metagenome]
KLQGKYCSLNLKRNYNKALSSDLPKKILHG